MIQTNNNNYNPDVLTCLANLSNDEVFTPPILVNKILDQLPTSLWSDSKTTFLDPVSKTGVFLREIAKRLIIGLEAEIPDLQTRIDHIYQKQLFAIALTDLTALMSRRTVYCSKYANGKYAVTKFDNEQGNIIYKPQQHTWHQGKCTFCGASQTEYDRPADAENYAYQFIHNLKPEEIFNMKFDVIAGNPPYQLSDGGAQASATPIYNNFVEQAIKMNPRYLTMIIPARWYSGGKGLDNFRSKLLNDKRLAQIHDFPETSDCFPGLNIRGGICYFLWDKEHNGDCKITNYQGGKVSKTVERPLLEKGADVFIRYNDAISILRKVKELKEKSFSSIVSSRKPFGLATNFDSFSLNETKEETIFLYRFGDNGYVNKNKIINKNEWINKYKVFVPYASPGNDTYPHLILSRPIVAQPNSISTETYLLIGPFDDEIIAQNTASYMMTSFFRFMILLLKSTQHITKNTYGLVPMQNFTESWTDKKLYEKYNITAEEQLFIDTLIRPME